MYRLYSKTTVTYAAVDVKSCTTTYAASCTTAYNRIQGPVRRDRALRGRGATLPGRAACSPAPQAAPRTRPPCSLGPQACMPSDLQLHVQQCKWIMYNYVYSAHNYMYSAYKETCSARPSASRARRSSSWARSMLSCAAGDAAKPPAAAPAHRNSLLKVNLSHGGRWTCHQKSDYLPVSLIWRNVGAIGTFR